MYEYRARLDRVIDGDTVDLVVDLGFHVQFLARIRLLGIDAPELRSRNKHERERAQLSKQYLCDLLDEHDHLTVRTTKTGKYGRWLGEIFTPDGQSTNTAMVQAGHATLSRS